MSGIKRDCECPRARHTHGTNQAYISDRCRCDECREARRIARTPQSLRDTKRWKYRRDSGIQCMTDLQPILQHIHALTLAGWSVIAIAEAADVPSSTMHNIIRGRHNRIHVDTAARIRAVRGPVTGRLIPGALIPAAGTRRRLEALLAIGWRHQDIERHLRMRGHMTQTHVVLHRGGPFVTQGIADAVREVFDEMSMTVGPSRVTAARAAKLGYAPPLAWDEDSIDDPAAQPCSPGGFVLYIERNRMYVRKPMDEVEVERFVSGHHVPLPAYAKSPERVEAIRRLAARGLSDSEVGAVVGMSGAAVLKIRERHGIPAGVEPTWVRRRGATEKVA